MGEVAASVEVDVDSYTELESADEVAGKVKFSQCFNEVNESTVAISEVSTEVDELTDAKSVI